MRLAILASVAALAPAQLAKNAEGVWSVTICPVEPDIYSYSFAVDGLAIAGPRNPQMKPEFVYLSETAAVQLAGGRVMLNARSEAKAHRRLVTYSQDGATRWTPPQFHQQLVEPGWAGYSDLAAARDGTIFWFHERGGLGDNAYRTAAFTLARFNLEWLTDGKDAYGKKGK